jgi:hypothetical protein
MLVLILMKSTDMVVFGPDESRLEEEILSSAQLISSVSFLFGATILSPKVPTVVDFFYVVLTVSTDPLFGIRYFDHFHNYFKGTMSRDFLNLAFFSSNNFP